MSKHTPGPWHWSNRYKTSDNERFTWSLIGANGYGILSCDGEENSPQGLGESGATNARLIAAAPELLDALLRVLRDVASDGRDGWEDQARAAVAKATGEKT
jgi:hypothetical protein